jgi:hypothetical protein
MTELSAWHYVLIGMLLFNTGITVGGFVMLIKNHIKHINEALTRIEKKVCTNDNRLDGHAVKIATLEERTGK